MHSASPNIACFKRPIVPELPLVASCPGKRIRNFLVRNKRRSHGAGIRCRAGGCRAARYATSRQETGCVAEELGRIGAVTSLLQLRRTRQDPQIVEDVIVSHRKTATNRTLAVRAEDTTHHPLGVVW